MSANPAFLMRLLASSFAVAEKAQAIIHRVLSAGDLCVVEKTGANDLQTKADLLVQQSICSSLARKFPKLTIIGEEDLPSQEIDEDLIESGQSEEVLKYSCPAQFSHFKEEDIVVWVDPLDGTKEFTEGFLDHVTVLIGIACGGKAIAGVINQPYYNYQAGGNAVIGRTIWGVLNLGVFGIELKEMPEGKHVITTSRSHSNKLVNECISAMNVDEVIRVGGAGNKVLQLIEGKASAYIFASPGCKKWDTCAPEAILHAVSGLNSLLTKLNSVLTRLIALHKRGVEINQNFKGTTDDFLKEDPSEEGSLRRPQLSGLNTHCRSQSSRIILNHVLFPKPPSQHPCIIEETGKMTDVHGNSFQYHKDVKHANTAGVLATLRNFDYYSSRVPDSVKMALIP